MNYLKAIESAAALEKLRRAYPELMGAEKFEALYRETEPLIRDMMTGESRNNPLAVVIPIAKRMKAAGKSIGSLLAVAAEMIHRDNKAREERGGA